jgi:hypothetical protein
MMDGVDFVDGMDTEKTHLPGEVHSVHNVHAVHYLDKSNWLELPNLGSAEHCALKASGSVLRIEC